MNIIEALKEAKKGKKITRKMWIPRDPKTSEDLCYSWHPLHFEYDEKDEGVKWILLDVEHKRDRNFFTLEEVKAKDWEILNTKNGGEK